MLNLAHWIQRLQADPAVEFDIHSAAALAAAQRDKGEKGRDGIYVVPLSDQATEVNNITGLLSQWATVRVGTVLSIRNRRDKRGSKGVDEVYAARLAVRNALLGWTPPDAEEPVQVRNSRLLQMDTEGTIWWQDEWETALCIEARA